jgi:DNA repair protein RecN (Recombination protein N)
MLQRLHIRDLALIEHAEVRLDPGLNVVSGETGGGKTLMVTALKLLRGEKATATLVRHGAAELRVDGEFLLEDGPRSLRVREVVRELVGADPEEDLLLVTRIVDARGRSRVRIGERPATLTALRQLGPWLLEIHGQGDSRGLMRPELQCETLDAFAGCADLREQFATRLVAARQAQARLQEASGSARERLARIEYLRFQLREMETVDLQPGELARLEEEHRVLAHLDRMRELLGQALAGLQEEEGSAGDRLGQAGRVLQEAAAIDRALAESVTLVEEAAIQVDEAARAVQSRLAALDLDPDRLQVVEERLGELRRALARFGPSEVEYLVCQQDARAELEQLTDAAATPEGLQQELATRLRAAHAAGSKLVRARRKAARPFCAAIEADLQDLGMAATRIRVEVALPGPAEELLESATAHGPTPLDLLVRVNPGEPFHLLRETASGGELARVVIAIKRCLADRDRVPFLALDEVDAEIGGRLGLAVGRKLQEVARHHQVLIVTHLPQVAAFADAHLKVGKEVVGQRTHTTIQPLEGAAAEAELAAMALGEGADEAAIAEARRLVQRARPSGS